MTRRVDVGRMRRHRQREELAIALRAQRAPAWSWIAVPRDVLDAGFVDGWGDGPPGSYYPAPTPELAGDVSDVVHANLWAISHPDPANAKPGDPVDVTPIRATTVPPERLWRLRTSPDGEDITLEDEPNTFAIRIPPGDDVRTWIRAAVRTEDLTLRPKWGPDADTRAARLARRREEERMEEACEPHPAVQDYVPELGECRRCQGRRVAEDVRRTAGDHFVHWVRHHAADHEAELRARRAGG